MKPGDEPVFQGKSGMAFEELEVRFQVLRRIETSEQCAVNKLVEVGAVIIEPGVHVTRRTRLERTLNPESVDCHMGKPLLGELSDVVLRAEQPGRPQAANEEVTEIPQPGKRSRDPLVVLAYPSPRHVKLRPILSGQYAFPPPWL